VERGERQVVAKELRELNSSGRYRREGWRGLSGAETTSGVPCLAIGPTGDLQILQECTTGQTGSAAPIDRLLYELLSQRLYIT
jgi:hypothetical protein